MLDLHDLTPWGSALAPLPSIPEVAFLEVAMRIQWVCKKSFNPFCRVIDFLRGSNNLVYVVEFDDGEKYVIRVPATGRGGSLAEACIYSSGSRHAIYIRAVTSILIPGIFAFYNSCNTPDAPFMALSFVHGCPADLTWFEPSGLDALEEWRVKILESLAGAMSQLQGLEFSHVGSLFPTGNALIRGPCYRWDYGTFGTKDYGRVLKVEDFGSFTSSQAYLQYCLASRPDGEIYRNPSINAGAQKILDMAISCLPHFTTEESADATFVVGLPDFNWQNIMTDGAGNVTSIEDWDNVQTKTGRLWYLTIPRLIATDWNPALYRLSTYAASNEFSGNSSPQHCTP
ncbi:hypothetical protein D8B26_006584 [Coccidioides posadasii str. Silveira]|uniref:uncharacterized protein n=1 Tax=Coccidioides posadasii (strain RMSCC 757 / Silveira) TaxID=443226 RepID=UPI001BEFDDDE|nr:hypothetical protein D8B26_006584 [Coccidioides posadasii str. Silveira]